MTKQEIRDRYKDMRSRLGEDQIKWLSKDTCFNFLTFINKSDILVHTYLPIKENNEIDTWRFINKGWEQFEDIRFCTSVTNFKTKEMKHYHITPDTDYTEDAWGIPVPKSIERVNLKEIDMVLIPLLAFDKHGNRVGYGGGYYDRFLSELRPDVIKVGISLFPAIDGDIPTEEHDIALDYVLNPDTVINFKEED